MEQYQQQLSELLAESYSSLQEMLYQLLPSLLGSIGLLLLGWLLARTIRLLILRAGEGIDRLIQVFNRSQTNTVSGWKVSQYLSTTLYWLVIIFFVTAAAENMGLPGLSHWLNQLMTYLPRVVAAGVVIFLGYMLSQVARNTLRGLLHNMPPEQASHISEGAYHLILIMAVLIGVGQLGIDLSLLVNLLTIVVAALFGGAAIALGMGARTAVANLFACQQLQHQYRVGDVVRLGNTEGRITEIMSGAVLLDTEMGQSMVPAHLFNKMESIRLEEEPLA